MSELMNITTKLKTIEKTIQMEADVIKDLSTCICGMTVVLDNIQKQLMEISKNGTINSK